MRHEQFVALMERRFEKTREVLDSKNAEYASKEDKLHNFRLAAGMTASTPEKALWGMLAKHLVSILDMVNGKDFNADRIDEKIGDAINYLILLEAILREVIGQVDSIQ